MDDVHLIVYGKSTEANCEILRKGNEICLHYGHTHEANIAPNKYELLYLNAEP